MHHAVTAEQMAEIDRRAQEEYGITQAVLMENAGLAVAKEILEDLGSAPASGHPLPTRIAVLCGKGNNGGDGFVAARLLNASGANITIFAAAIGGVKKGAAADNLMKVQELALDIRLLDDFLPEGFDIAVDAMFGTGFKGELNGVYANAGAALNSSEIRVYAVDISSGLDATTGYASKNTPQAFKTITLGLPKNGFYIKDGPRISGEILVKDIGFPQELLREYST